MTYRPSERFVDDVAAAFAECNELRRLCQDIQGALNTEEVGQNLVEVARDACRAKQELAALKQNVGA